MSFVKPLPEGVRYPALSFLVAVVAVCAALVARWLLVWLFPALSHAAPFALVYVAVAVSAWGGGYRAGFLSAVLGYVASVFFFSAPPGITAGAAGVASLLGYTLASGIIIWLGDTARTARLDSSKSEAARQRAEGRLQASDRLGHIALESMTDSFFTLDTHWRFEFVNSAAEQLLERRPGELLGQVIWQACPGIVSSDIERLYRSVVDERKAGSIIAFYPDHGRWYDIRAYPSVSGMSVYFRDVSEQKKAEEAVRTSEAMRRLALESAGLGSWNLDPVTRTLTTDKRFSAIFGRLEASMSYEDTVAAIHPDDLERNLTAVTAALRPDDPAPYQEEYRVIWPDGSIHWVMSRGRANFEGDGPHRKLKSFDGTVAEVTDRKLAEARLREADQQFRTLADNMPQLAWTAEAGSHGKANWFNRSWLAYTGTTLEEMAGSGWQKVHHPDHAERVIAKFSHHVEHALDWEDTFPLRRHDGEFRWFLSRMNIIRNASGEVARIFGTNTDITDERNMAQQLQQQSDALREADRRKDVFLATLAHELRNPLAPLRNSLQILRLASAGDTAVAPSKALGRACEVMERQLKQMTRLVDDLLDVSRISGDKLTLRRQRLSLAEVLGNAAEASQPLIDAAGLTFDLTLPATPIELDGDLTRLAQVFMNLLNNAAKFTEPKGHISMHAERDGDDVLVTVRDSGIGLPADQLHRIFEMFTQVDSSLDRAQDGLGIGLTLVRRFVQMHGGEVYAHSQGPGHGSSFTVRLPALPPEASTPTPAPVVTPEPAAVRPLHILVVDDNRDAALTLADMLQLMDHETQVVHDGPAAIEAARACEPDLVLLDIGMPGMNGYEVARRIRSEPWGRTIKLFALTGWGQEEDRRQSRAAGFDHHLVKPLDPAELEQLLQQLTPSPAETTLIAID